MCNYTKILTVSLRCLRTVDNPVLGAVEPEVPQKTDKAITNSKVGFEPIAREETCERGNKLRNLARGQLESSGRFSMEIVDRGRGETSYQCVELLFFFALRQITNYCNTLKEVVKVNVVESGVAGEALGNSSSSFEDLVDMSVIKD